MSKLVSQETIPMAWISPGISASLFLTMLGNNANALIQMQGSLNLKLI